MIAASIVIGAAVGALSAWLTFTYLETNKDDHTSDPSDGT